MRNSLIVVAAASVVVAGCQVHAQEGGGGPDVSRTYQVGDFQKVEVAGPYDVQVRTGANVSVSAHGSQKLLERTVVEVEGDKLVIRPEHRGGWFHIGWSTRGKATFVVTVPKIDGATIAGSGDVHVDRVAGPEFEGTVAGSGGIDVAQLDVQKLKLAIAGSGGVKGAGKAQSADYSIAGSGDVDAAGIQTQDLKVSIAGSGGVHAHSSGTADVSIMGSGDVDVSGGAKCKVSKMGSGNARCS